MKFKDYFSEVAEGYAQTRFIYPPEIFAWLAEIAPNSKLAWDCGTGNGQAAIGLAKHFERVVATDASASQIAYARPHPHIEYKVALAKESGLADASVALVTSFLAAHWFDHKAFFAEVRRVMVDQGICALWCYDVPKISADIDPILEEFYFETMKPWAPPERALIDTRYRDFEFPFEVGNRSI